MDGLKYVRLKIRNATRLRLSKLRDSAKAAQEQVVAGDLSDLMHTVKLDLQLDPPRLSMMKPKSSMPRSLKRNAIAVLTLAGLFGWSFMFAKHDLAFRTVIPFGNDPYDAVGSFGVLFGIFAALLSLVHAFRRYYEPAPSRAQLVYLIRTQTAVVLMVLVTLAADTVALVRHPSQWAGAPSRNALMALLSGLAILAIAVQLAINRSRPKDITSLAGDWRRAMAAVALAVLVLFLYPEELIDSTATHLLTVIAGILILFAPARPLLKLLVPLGALEADRVFLPRGGRFLNSGHRWGIVFLIGASIGGVLFAAEMSEGGSSLPPFGQLVSVASVYVGLAIAGFVIAYAFLGRALGLAVGGAACGDVESNRG